MAEHQSTLINLIGQRFHRLTVCSQAPTKSGRTRWRCQCDCGRSLIVIGKNLRNGNTKSCGCLSKEMRRTICLTHGRSHTPEYRVWSHMRERCYNPRDKAYRYYGQRGISVCRRWRESFANFYSDMGSRPSLKYSIDRKNNDGGYWCGHCTECLANNWPANCKWATQKEQVRNRSCNKTLTFLGQTRLIQEWAEILGMTGPAIRNRLKKGWSPERALSTPLIARPRAEA